jgi:hypothetical protein
LMHLIGSLGHHCIIFLWKSVKSVKNL